jgi:hypothetical protein
MAIQITNIADKNFGNCVKMTNGLIELLVTMDFGPRVISCSRVGMENIMYQDLEQTKLGDPQDIYEGEHLKLFGGHRLWISPEVLPRCYYPDHQKVETKPIKNGMMFIAPVEKHVNIQKTITITLDETEPVAYLDHTIRNCGLWEIEVAPWCITMMAQGGKEIVPMSGVPTELLPNRNIVLWDYTKMNDARIYWGENYITLKQDPTNIPPFKFGMLNDEGWAAYFVNKQLFIKKFDPNVDGEYPDGGCNFETYTNGKMLEVETLGELVLLEPNEEISTAEEWYLFEEERVPGDCEDEVAEILGGYL